MISAPLCGFRSSRMLSLFLRPCEEVTDSTGAGVCVCFRCMSKEVRLEKVFTESSAHLERKMLAGGTELHTLPGAARFVPTQPTTAVFFSTGFLGARGRKRRISRDRGVLRQLRSTAQNQLYEVTVSCSSGGCFPGRRAAGGGLRQ